MQKDWSTDKTLLQSLQGWEQWQGSHYELSMYYPSSSLDQQVRLRLLQTLWNDPHLSGVIDEPTKFGEAWQCLDAIETGEGKHYYGCILLPGEKITGCASCFIRSGNATWLSLYIPSGLLERVFPVSYPLTREQNPWIKDLDAFLSALGARAYQSIPFTVATLGEEASATPIEYLQANLSHDTGLLVSEEQFRQRGIAPYGLQIGEELWWTGG